MSAKLEGVEPLLANLNRLSGKPFGRVIRNATSASLTPMQRRYRDNARAAGLPRGAGDRWARSLRKKSKFYPHKMSAYALVGPRNEVDTEGTNWSKVAHLIELGTKAHINLGRYAGTWHPGTAPRPVARPAFDATKSEASASFVTNLKRGIDRELRKAGKL